MIEFVDKTLAQIDWDSRNELRSYDPSGAIIVMGAGGLGWWTVAGLLRCEDITNKFIIYDEDDFVGGQGKKRLPIPANETNRKVNELAGWLTEWMFAPVSDRVSVKTYKFTNASIFSVRSVALILDCTDAPISSRNIIYEAAWEAGIPVLRGSYDGEMVTFGYRPPDSVVDDGGYNLVPNMAVTFAAAGMVAESVRRFLRGEVVKPFTYHFGPVWRSATGNDNEQIEIQDAIGQAIEQELSLNEQIQQAIDEGDPLVIGENGEILGRLSEFELEEDELDEESIPELDEQLWGTDEEAEEDEPSNNASTYSSRVEPQINSETDQVTRSEASRPEIFHELADHVQPAMTINSFQSAMSTMLEHARQAMQADLVGDGYESPIFGVRSVNAQISAPLQINNGIVHRFYESLSTRYQTRPQLMPPIVTDPVVPENTVILRSPSGDEVVYHLPEGEPNATNDES